MSAFATLRRTWDVTSGLAGVVLLGVWLSLANALPLVGYKAAQQV